MMRVLIKRQDHLCVAHRLDDGPGWVVTLCYLAVRQALGRPLARNEEVVADFQIKELLDGDSGKDSQAPGAQ